MHPTTAIQNIHKLSVNTRSQHSIREALIMTIANMTALFGTMLVLSITPGPSDFAVVARSLAAGFRQGLIMTCGIIAGDFILMAFAIYSLSELAESMNSLFVAVKYLCGAYLIWMGVGSIRARPTVTQMPTAESSSRYASFFSGLFITLGDPGAIVFYMGLLPAFVNLRGISLADTLTIMLMSAVIISSVKLSEAYLVDKAKRLFENINLRKTLNIVAGCTLIGTGVVLFVQ